jgi:ribose transport system permease protein
MRSRRSYASGSVLAERLAGVARRVSPSNISALYLGSALFIVFAIWIPETFLSQSTLKTVLADQAVTTIAAVAVIVPMAAGGFDLSVGFGLGMAATVATKLMKSGHSPYLAISAALGAALLVGLVNGALVGPLRIDSLVATLGTGSVIQAMTLLMSNASLYGVSPGFAELGYNSTFGVPWSVIVMAVVAIAVWYMLEHTPLGRYIYASGANREAARLSGVPTNACVFGTFVISGVVAGLAGLLYAARINGSSPNAANSYLLPAFAAVFLGATQLRHGRVNIWGTVLAVYALAIGTKGFLLLGVQDWISSLFYGIALIAAVLLASRRGVPTAKRLLRNARATEAATSADARAAKAPPARDSGELRHEASSRM